MFQSKTTTTTIYNSSCNSCKPKQRNNLGKDRQRVFVRYCFERLQHLLRNRLRFFAAQGQLFHSEGSKRISQLHLHVRLPAMDALHRQLRCFLRLLCQTTQVEEEDCSERTISPPLELYMQHSMKFFRNAVKHVSFRLFLMIPCL